MCLRTANAVLRNAYVSHSFTQRLGFASLLSKPANTDDSFRQKYVRVSILGVDTPAGEATAFLLKQNPVVSQIYLHGSNDVLGITADLKHLDTRCDVRSYHGKEGLPRCLKRADIVLIMGLDKSPANATTEVKLRMEAERLMELGEACSRYSPKALIAVCVSPTACTLPLVNAVFKKTHWYHPARIIGSAALTQTRINSLTARYQDLDPLSVHVPLLGGPDIDCVVPLFSRAIPEQVAPKDCEILYEKMKNINELVPSKTPTPCEIEFSPLSEAHAINQMVTTMGIGLCGDDRALCAAFVRQSILSNCSNLVTTVKFGPGGVVHNYGVPKLTRQEVRLLEKSMLTLEKREKLALDIFRQIESQPGQRLSQTIQLSSYADKRVTIVRD